MSNLLLLRRRSSVRYVPNKHRYWRIRSLKIQGNGASDNFALREVEMRAYPGGSDQCSGGTALSDSDYDGTAPKANAFDNSTSTIWSSATGSFGNHWIGYDFGTPVNVNEVFINSRTDYLNSNVLTAYIESSDDGSTWTTQWKHTLMADWSAGETRTLTRPASGDVMPYWRLHFVQNFALNNYDSFAELAIYQYIGGSNVASASVIVADTTYDGTATVTNLFDGSAGTWWASGNVPAGTGNPHPHWLLWTPASASSWARFEMTARNATPTLMPAIIIMQASTDQKTWVDHRRMGYPSVTASVVYPFDNLAPYEFIAA